MKRAIDILLAVVMALNAAAVDTRTGIFSPDFKSLTVQSSDGRLAPPVLQLGNPSSRLLFGFDQLAEDNSYLRCRLLHCNADWRPSSLAESEYADGFNLADITSYALSEHTLTHYVHYDIELPNEEMMPLVSGNYLLQVYDPDDPDETLLQARFMVSEQSAGLHATMTTATDVDHNARHQQLEVEADIERAGVDDPFNDLLLMINQNDATVHSLPKPLRINGSKAIYAHQQPLIFKAGNEYRRFEMTNVHYPGIGVERFSLIEPFYHARLIVDQPRAERNYVYDQDQDGRFFPNVLFNDYPDTEADYIVTHFELQSPEMPFDVYVEGDLTQRRLDDDSRMYYDPSRQAYIKTLLLKQGLYNYRYTTADGSSWPEGDYHETQNRYTVMLYHRPPHARYDRLIAVLTL